VVAAHRIARAVADADSEGASGADRHLKTGFRPMSPQVVRHGSSFPRATDTTLRDRVPPGGEWNAKAGPSAQGNRVLA
jgi:hypothetical protein